MADTAELVQDRALLIAAYINAGLALIPIKPGVKETTAKGWNLPGYAIRTHEEADKRLKKGNIGLAHAFCTPTPTCALDLDDLTKARPWLAARGIDVDALLADPEAVRIDSGREGRAKLLYRLPEPLATQKPADSGLELRCATKEEGKTVQDVLPPSIHPDTGCPYILIGDPAKIPPIPEPLLALWRRLEGAKPRGKKLDKLKTDDPILRTLNVLGMVRADKGNGAYWIECPFEDQHTSFTGDGETIYYLPHTNGFVQAHFKCLHAHCDGRTDNDFMSALLVRTVKQTGKPPAWGVQAATTVPVVQPKGDSEFAWLLRNAPAAAKAYIQWYMDYALLPLPAFALYSVFVFAQALVGSTVALKRGTRANLWLLILARSEAGKGDVLRMPAEAIDQLVNLKFRPAISIFEREHASAAGLWWRFVKAPQQLLVDDELGQTFIALINSKPGSEGHRLRRAYMYLYSSADKQNVAPSRYTDREKSAKEMPLLHYPYLSIVGTGVLETVSSLSAGAANEGFTNRPLIAVIEELADIGNVERGVGPLPDVLIKQAAKLCMLAPKNPFEAILNDPDCSVKPLGQYMKPRTLETYAGFNDDWKVEMKYGQGRAQELLDIWGRYAEKVIKVAMLLAVLDDGKQLTKANFIWAKHFVRWSNEKAGKYYSAEGGGAANEMDAMAKAFMHAFDKAPRVKETGAVLGSDIGKFAGNKWRTNKDNFMRERVIKTLIADGLIEEVSLQPKGMSYRKLTI